MEAVTWTALGNLAAFSLGVLALQTHASRFDAVKARLDSVNTRLDTVEDRTDRAAAELRATKVELGREIQALGDRLEGRLEEHEARHHP